MEGTVKKADGSPWSNSPVFLEGMSMIYSQADGSFRFQSVPAGMRWIVVYRPAADVFDAEAITVVAGGTVRVDLVPDTSYRMNFEYPALHGAHIYHRFSVTSIRWTDLDGSASTEVYAATGSCTGIPDVDGFDVASTSGRLAIMDYQEGCPTNRGLYLADKNGGNLQLLVDMKADYNWNGAQEVFWSPDESRIALKGSYQWYTWLMVFDATAGNFLGGIYFPQGYSLLNVSLHGWSPDGRWLLFSYWQGQPSSGTLAKIRVNADGSLDNGSIVNLLTNTSISGATWGRLGTAAAQGRRSYLPLVVK